MHDDDPMPTHQQLEELYEDLAEVFTRHGVVSAAVSMGLGEFIGATWFPGCGDDCPTKNRCSAVNLRLAVKNLQELIEAHERKAMERGEPPLADNDEEEQTTYLN